MRPPERKCGPLMQPLEQKCGPLCGSLSRNAAPRIIYVVLRNTRTNVLIRCTLSGKALKIKGFPGRGLHFGEIGRRIG